jgi:WD40 repeat protein
LGYIISGGTGFLKIYNLKGQEVANLVGHTGEVWSIGLDGDRLVSGSDDQTIGIL